MYGDEGSWGRGWRFLRRVWIRCFSEVERVSIGGVSEGWDGIGDETWQAS